MPLRVRLTLLFALGTALVLLLAGTLFYLLLRANLRDAVDTDLRTRADVLTARLADRIAAGEPVPGRGDPAALLTGAGSIAQVLTPEGRPLASSADAGTAPLLAVDERARARSHPVWIASDADDRALPAGQARLYAVPVRAAAGGSPLVAVVGTPTHLTDRAEDRVRNVMVTATAPLIALSGLAAWLLSGAALRPVDRMRRQAAEMAASDLGTAGDGFQLAVPATRDEIAALARTMNDLLARLHAARARDRAFVADAGHELRTPLTVLRAELELADRPGRSAEQLREAIHTAAEETDRLIRLAESLLTLARMDGGHVRRGPLALDELLDRAARAAAGYAASRGLRLDVTVPAGDRPLTVFGDPDLLRQAVDNLLANGVRHAPPGSAVELRGHRAPGRADGVPGVVVVQVRDHGAGFPAAFLPHAFERFRRADAARGRDDGGAGLGLSIVAAIAAAHGGTVEAANDPGGGALVTITLPPVPDPPDMFPRREP
ncbi:signal transduction histidine kinase [Frankia torreyi]|uniref:histidine kinase n=2 Tax=Frankia TaxID=1854 RepID=A0A0D8BLL4_9ACTN|nr:MULTISPECIES: ATP-binding protein [Frankia]KJE25148.1 signal transduction histidine kinase [Frankia torreyi]KQC37706.1 histidine kinase [Frankia sp. ACN1ag]KQM08036.1 signal transduction histidine kinase [Frankia sp. CpI1-P]